MMGGRRRGRSAARRFIAVLVVLAALWLAAALAPGELARSPETLAAALRGLGPGGPFLLGGVMVLAVVVGPIPTFPVSVTAGLAYGPLLGTVYAIAGATLGALAAFAIARFGGRALAARVLRGHVAFCSDCSDRLLFWVVLVARLVPVVSFALVSYAAGLTAMSARAFALATAVGMLPMTVVYVTLGAALQLSPAWFIATGGVIVLALFGAPLWLERHAPDLLRRLTGGVHADQATPLSARNGDSS